MTESPPVLVADRKLLLDHLDMHPGRTVDDDLDPAEVGIKGDTSHVEQGNSYHLGTPEQARTGYASTESPRDKAGLCAYASALDIGWFEVRVAGKVHNLRSFSLWAVAQCKANKPDTRDIREIIYTADGRTVKRWDRLGKRSGGDSSHLFHTHFSLFRDATKAGRGLTALLTRYLTEIGVIDMAFTADEEAQIRKQAALALYDVLTVAVSGKPWNGLLYEGKGAIGESVRNNFGALASGPAVAAIGALAGKLNVDVDEEAIASALLRVLTPKAIAAAIPDTIAAEVVDELAARVAS